MWSCKLMYPRNATAVGKHAAWAGIALGFLILSSRLSAQQPKLRLTFRGQSEEVRCVAISPDGKTLVSGIADNTIRFWDVALGKEWASLTGHNDKILSLTFSADGKRMASGSADKTIKVWDVAKAR
jgi:WD40 repeat protein